MVERAITQVEQHGMLTLSTPLAPDVMEKLALSFTVSRPLQSRGFSMTEDGPRMMTTYDTVNELMFSVQDDGVISILSGLRDKFLAFLKANGIAHTFVDRTPTLTPDYENFKRVFGNIEWRLRQKEAIGWIISENNGTIIAPVGWGKSLMVSIVCALYPTTSILVAVPEVELAKDMYKRLSKDHASVGLFCTGHKKAGRINVATCLSMYRAQKYNPQIMIIDELHRMGSRSMIDAAIQMTTPVKRFGLTATHGMRSDGCDVWCEAITGPVRMQVTYMDAQEAKAVVPMYVTRLHVGQGPSSKDLYDIVQKKQHLYWRNEYRNSLIALSIKDCMIAYKIPEDEQVLILVNTVEHALNLQKFLPDYTIIHKKVGVDGAVSAKEMQQAKLDFERGVLRKVITTVWRTGIDFPKLRVVVEASGDNQGIKLCQGGGRGSRIAEGKDYALVIDVNDAWDSWASKRAAIRSRHYSDQGWTVSG